MRPAVRGVGLALALSLGVLALTAGGQDEPSSLTAGAAPADVPFVAPVASPPTASPSTSPSASPSASPTARPTLPRGGRSVFPEHVVVGFYGSGSGPALGVLGEGTPDQAAARLERAAAPFGPASGRTVLPAFEFITTVAQRSPGADGSYSAAQSDATVQRYLDAARRAKALMVLDLQPGRADFLSQAKRYERFLVQPDVGLGLDPEWKLAPGQLPGRQIGRTSAAEINAVSAWLQGLVRRHDLPEKLFVVHQFKLSMIPDRSRVVARPGLATVLHVDGFGAQGVKRDVYGTLASRRGELVNGFKLFYDEDTDLMTPREAMALRPRPELITYQ